MENDLLMFLVLNKKKRMSSLSGVFVFVKRPEVRKTVIDCFHPVCPVLPAQSWKVSDLDSERKKIAEVRNGVVFPWRHDLYVRDL